MDSKKEMANLLDQMKRSFSLEEKEDNEPAYEEPRKNAISSLFDLETNHINQ
jgi:hypothetical protein